jgi:hypothetical protein
MGEPSQLRRLIRIAASSWGSDNSTSLLLSMVYSDSSGFAELFTSASAHGITRAISNAGVVGLSEGYTRET